MGFHGPHGDPWDFMGAHGTSWQSRNTHGVKIAIIFEIIFVIFGSVFDVQVLGSIRAGHMDKSCCAVRASQMRRLQSYHIVLSWMTFHVTFLGNLF